MDEEKIRAYFKGRDTGSLIQGDAGKSTSFDRLTCQRRHNIAPQAAGNDARREQNESLEDIVAPAFDPHNSSHNMFGSEASEEADPEPDASSNSSEEEESEDESDRLHENVLSASTIVLQCVYDISSTHTSVASVENFFRQAERYSCGMRVSQEEYNRIFNSIVEESDVNKIISCSNCGSRLGHENALCNKEDCVSYLKKIRRARARRRVVEVYADARNAVTALLTSHIQDIVRDRTRIHNYVEGSDWEDMRFSGGYRRMIETAEEFDAKILKVVFSLAVDGFRRKGTRGENWPITGMLIDLPLKSRFLFPNMVVFYSITCWRHPPQFAVDRAPSPAHSQPNAKHPRFEELVAEQEPQGYLQERVPVRANSLDTDEELELANEEFRRIEHTSFGQAIAAPFRHLSNVVRRSLERQKKVVKNVKTIKANSQGKTGGDKETLSWDCVTRAGNPLGINLPPNMGRFVSTPSEHFSGGINLSEVTKQVQHNLFEEVHSRRRRKPNPKSTWRILISCLVFKTLRNKNDMMYATVRDKKVDNTLIDLTCTKGDEKNIGRIIRFCQALADSGSRGAPPTSTDDIFACVYSSLKQTRRMLNPACKRRSHEELQTLDYYATLVGDKAVEPRYEDTSEEDIAEEPSIPRRVRKEYSSDSESFDAGIDGNRESRSSSPILRVKKKPSKVHAVDQTTPIHSSSNPVDECNSPNSGTEQACLPEKISVPS